LRQKPCVIADDATGAAAGARLGLWEERGGRGRNIAGLGALTSGVQANYLFQQGLKQKPGCADLCRSGEAVLPGGALVSLAERCKAMAWPVVIHADAVCSLSKSFEVGT